MAPRFVLSRAMYRLLLSLLPATFRRRFGPDMEEDFAELMAAKTAEQPIAGRVRGWRVAVADLARTSSRERGHATLAAIRLDVKEAVRRLVRTPAFTLGVIATLGVGLAVATLTFAIVDGVWLRPLPYLDPDRVVMVSSYGLSTAEFASVRAERATFTDVTGYSWSFAPLTLLGDEPQMLRQTLVTPNFLEVLSVRPALGQPRFDDPGTGDREVMLSHRLWTQRFGSDPAIVGRRVMFEDGPRQVVGVLAPDFFFPAPNQILMPDVLTVLDAAPPKPDRWIRVIGRLQPGVTVARASAVVDAIVQRPDIPAWRLRPPGALSVRSLADETVGDYVRNMMALLFGGVAVLLLIASLNLMHMLVARGLGRAREVAVRRALGARRIELVRLFLLEALMLAAAGGVVAWLLSLWAFDFVRALVPAALVRGAFVTLNARVSIACVSFALAVGVLSGLFPALRLSRAKAEDLLERHSRGVSARSRLGKLLVALETGLAVVLVVGGSLMMNSFVRLGQVDLGFQPDRLLQVHLTLPSAMSEADGHDYVDRVFTDVGALPFVRDAAISDMPLVMRASRGEDLHGEGSSRDKIDVDWRAVSPDYFHVLGVRMIDGREFTRADRNAAVEPAIVSESVARQLWPEGRAIGRRFQADAHKLTCEVIGVVADTRSFAVRSAPPLMMYLSTDRRRVSNLYLTVRVANTGGMEAIVAPIRQQVRAADPRVAIPDVRTADDLVGDSVADTRMEAALFSVFGALALGVAMAGVAGITAYAVTRRTKELGIRLALGLAPSGIARMLVAESLVPAAIGTAVGSGAALALANLLGHLVFGISARDPATFALVAAGLLAAAIVASYVPARRASRLDPTTALRAE